MKPPFILCDSGDVLLFESIASLEMYVESPDTETYRVFDAEGYELRLIAHPGKNSKGKCRISLEPVTRIRVIDAEERRESRHEVELLLREFLSRVKPGPDYGQAVLPELIAQLQSEIGFTR